MCEDHFVFFFATSPAPRPPFSYQIHSGKKSNTNLIVTPQEVQEVTVSANGWVILNYCFGKVSVLPLFFFALRHQYQVLTAFFPMEYISFVLMLFTIQIFWMLGIISV